MAMYRGLSFVAAVSSLFALLLVTAPTSRAQTPQQDEASGTLQEVIVTARRREESLMKTPVSVTAFSSDDLISRQIEHANQIAEATPNLTFRNIGGESNIAAVVYIRGIGERDFIPTVQPGVGLYVDGVYIAQIVGALTEMVDMESIEVLRGPQGTLFGRNTIGGAILFNTKKPAPEFAANVDISAGDFDLRQAKGSINVPFTDTFYGKLSALYRHKDGYVDTPNIAGDDGLGSDDTRAARLALRWVPNETFTLDLAGDYNHIESDGVPRVFGSQIVNLGPVSEYNDNVAPALGLPQFTTAAQWLPLDSYESNADYHVRAEADIYNLNLTMQKSFGGLTLKSITSYRSMETWDGADGDNGSALVNINDDLMDGEQWSEELHLTGTAAQDRLRWLAGLYYFESDITNLNFVHFPFFSLLSGAVVNIKSAAAFGQATYSFTQKASLTLGLRYTDEQLDSVVDDRHQFVTSVFDPTCRGACAGTVVGARGTRPGVDGYRPLPLPPAPGSFKIQPNNLFESDASETEPYVNFAYQWTDDFMTYLSYAEGFKGGGFTQRIPPGRVVEAFGPEFAKVYELGGKWLGLQNRLRVTAAAFFTDYEDLQVAVNRQLGGTIENGGDAEIKGFELEIVAAPTPGIQLSAGIGHMDGEYVRLDPAATTPIGARMPSIMDWQGNASASYRAPIQSGALTFRADYSYVGGHYVERDNVPSAYIKGYDLVNAAITYSNESGNWDLALQGRNIFDELYYTTTFLDQNTQGYSTFLLAPPRELSVRFQYRF